MTYTVINFFTDLQDFNHPYSVGDTFPREGMKATEERIKELSGSKNRQGKPLIKADRPVSDEETIKPFSYTKTEINRMSTSELQKVASENGIKGAKDMTGSELKKVLIQKFEL
ncbi:MAG: hypothetical protein ACI4EU_02985 [Butyrivibrio sp.]